MVRLLADYQVHPREILTELEVDALRGQAGERWPVRLEEDRFRSLQLNETDFADLGTLVNTTGIPVQAVVDVLTAVSRLDTRALARSIDAEVMPLARPSGGRVWRATSRRHGTLYLIGTMHSTGIEQLERRGADAMIDFLEATPFTHVFEEVTANLSTSIRFPRGMGLGAYLNLTRLAATEPPTRESRRAFGRLANLGSGINWASTGMDDPVAAIALRLHRGNFENVTYGGLETRETRNVVGIGTRHRRASPLYDDRYSHAHLPTIERAIQQGDERTYWRIIVDEYLGRGIDVQSSDARNLQWILQVDRYGANHTVLWVVGAGHIPGLLVRLHERSFTIEPWL